MDPTARPVDIISRRPKSLNGSVRSRMAIDRIKHHAIDMHLGGSICSWRPWLLWSPLSLRSVVRVPFTRPSRGFLRGHVRESVASNR